MSRIREGVLSFVNYVAAILQGGGESAGPGAIPSLGQPGPERFPSILAAVVCLSDAFPRGRRAFASRQFPPE